MNGLWPSGRADRRRSLISAEVPRRHTTIASGRPSETSNPPEVCTRGGRLLIWLQRFGARLMPLQPTMSRGRDKALGRHFHDAADREPAAAAETFDAEDQRGEVGTSE